MYPLDATMHGSTCFMSTILGQYIRSYSFLGLGSGRILPIVALMTKCSHFATPV
jgi:hypothetical protein